ncbi:MAG: hypothetical protein EBS60_05535 [Verrucomicrobia bacterium]|nr:hypothetical protein [Verrucomicrobiota bacterium]
MKTVRAANDSTKSDKLHEELVFYRGICIKPVEKKQVLEKIAKYGLNSNDQHWHKTEFVDHKGKLAKLLKKSDLTVQDVRPSKMVSNKFAGQTRVSIGAEPAVCACGDETGATYYALKHNRNEKEGKTEALIIKFKAPVKDTIVDGCDFMFTCMQFGASDQHKGKLVEIFGRESGKYYDLARKSAEQDFRIAIAYLAVQDPRIILNHYNNKTVIGGRWGTIFRSAFQIKLPIPAERIIDVFSPRLPIPSPEILVKDVR